MSPKKPKPGEMTPVPQAQATIRVLSMWNPWAWLTVYVPPGETEPAKLWETRAFRPPTSAPLPIPVVIHATKRNETPKLITSWPFNDLMAKGSVSLLARGMFSGYLLGVAEIIQVRPTDELIEEWGNQGAGASRNLREIGLGDYTAGRFGWRLANQYQFPEPIPFQGRQSVLYPLADPHLGTVQTILEKNDVQSWKAHWL